ncbi:MAG TPA: plastocyanin/azurin family copper-binding protein [Polyangia bacterium]|jgi:plastocyanin
MRSVWALSAVLVLASVASCGSGADMTTDAGLTDDGGGGCTAATAVAATAVTVSDFKFAPACIKVAAGATVTWTNTGMPIHTVTSDSGAPVTFNSGALGSGGTFHFTFPAAGTVGYHCIPHQSLGMVGTVVVE